MTRKNTGYLLPPPSGKPASLGAADEVASMLETDASGLLNIQSVAFSMSPPWRAVSYTQEIYNNPLQLLTSLPLIIVESRL